MWFNMLSLFEKLSAQPSRNCNDTNFTFCRFDSLVCSFKPPQAPENCSKLYLAVLQCLVEAKTKSSNINLILNSQHLGIIINSIQTKAELLKMGGQKPEDCEEMQISLERFAQAIQIGLASNCIFGSVVQLLRRFRIIN
jgi:hypothetical protein